MSSLVFQGGVSSRMSAPITAFSARSMRRAGTLDSGSRSDALHIALRSGGPGVVEIPELDAPRIAVYIGKPVRLYCMHGRECHSGLAIHGDIDIIPGRMPSRWEMEEPDTALVLRLGCHVLREAADEFGLKDRIEIRSRFRVRDYQIEQIAWALMAEAQSGYPSGRLYLDCMATALAVQLLRNHNSSAINSPSAVPGMSPRKLRQVQCHIEDNLGFNLSLGMIAEAAGMSISHLKSTFRMSTGMPVHQYVIQRRVERAAVMLREGRLTIGEIAAEVGFTHQSHLAMHMKRLMGVTPSQFLRSAA